MVEIQYTSKQYQRNLDFFSDKTSKETKRPTNPNIHALTIPTTDKIKNNIPINAHATQLRRVNVATIVTPFGLFKIITKAF